MRCTGGSSSRPGIDTVEQAFDAWKYGTLSERPYLEAIHPVDRTPRCTCARAVGARTRADPDQVGERVVAELERHAPGIGGLVDATGACSRRRAIERELGLSGGHVYHAEPGLDQFFAWRPVLGLARYRLGVRGLYLCGVGRPSGRRHHRRPGPERGPRDPRRPLRVIARSGGPGVGSDAERLDQPRRVEQDDQPLANLCDPVQIPVL